MTNVFTPDLENLNANALRTLLLASRRELEQKDQTIA